LTVQSNAVVKDTGTTGNEIQHNVNVEVNLNSGGVLDLNGQSEYVDMTWMNNGVLRNAQSASTSTLNIQNYTPSGFPVRAITLQGMNCLFDTPPVDAILNINAHIVGSGTLVKTGLGTVVLLTTNYYTGNITVSNGALSLSYPDITNTATVTIATNSVLNLNFANADTNTVSSLIVNGVSKSTGLYNNSTDPLYLTGSGNLLVIPTINSLPGPIQFSVTGTALTLSWPTNLGWILQSQTNALNVGLVATSNAWFDVAGSAGVTSTNMVITPANPSVFYRLRHP